MHGGRRAQVPDWVGRGIALYYVGFCVGRLAPLVIVPVLSRVLGVRGYGDFEASYAVLAAGSIVFDAGIGSGLLRFVEHGSYTTRELAASAGRLQLVASLGAATLVAPSLIAVSPENSGAAVLIASAVAFALIEGYASMSVGFLRAEARDGLFLLLSLARLVTTAGAASVGAVEGGTGGALLGVSVGGAPFAAYALFRVAQAGPCASRAAERALLAYGLPLMATAAMTWALAFSDRVFLGVFSPARDLAIYSVNYRLGNVILVFLAAPLPLAWIALARKIESQRELRAASVRWFRAFSVGALGSTVGLLVAGPTLVPAVFGDEFTADRYVLAAVGVSAWLAGVYILIATPIVTSTQTLRLTVVAGGVVGVNLLANSVLIPVADGRGAATATVVSYSALCVFTAVAAGGPRAIDWMFTRGQLALVIGLLLAIAAATLGSPVTALITLGATVCVFALLRSRRWAGS
jgi:O-antigen/teichoic acid export membrane protein